MESKYETDFFGWANEQAALPRAGRLSEVDLEHVAEEIDDMGRGTRGELVNRLSVILAHLLKSEFQPEFRGKSWRLTIVEQRRRMAKLLRRNPSLGPFLLEALSDAYEFAVPAAERESRPSEDAFPASCPYSIQQILDADFWPGGPPPIA